MFNTSFQSALVYILVGNYVCLAQISDVSLIDKYLQIFDLCSKEHRRTAEVVNM